MRLLLDAHLSARRIAPALRDRGHDVCAVDEDRSLDGWSDEQLLRLAKAENRLLVTFNARDFDRLVRAWAEARRAHEGCLILVRMDHGEFGLIVQRVLDTLDQWPNQTDWHDRTVFVGRSA